jgi:uncharacterized membrane protein
MRKNRARKAAICMSKGCLFSFFGVAVIVLGIAVAVVAQANAQANAHPLSKSKEEIRARLLERTPLGTDIETVLNSRPGSSRYVYENFGIVMSGDIPYPATSPIPPGQEPIGEKAIKAYLGSYTPRWPFSVYVEAYYAFDGDGKLIEIAIWKGSNH